MRIVFIGFFIVLLVLTCILAMRYGQEARIAEQKLNSERFLRMTVEENFKKANQRIQSLTDGLAQAEKRMQTVTVALEKTKGINNNLKLRLDNAAKTRASLDQKISELQAMVVVPMQ